MEPALASPPWGAPLEDETLARSALVGSLTHLVIARLLSRQEPVDEHPVWRLALDEADRLLYPPLLENRAHRQAIAGAAVAYFRWLLPPRQWSYGGAEPSIRGMRPDLLWCTSNGYLLLDELKTGRGPFDLQRAQMQALQYAGATADVYGDRVRGVRLIFTASPAASWLVRADRSCQPLFGTGFVREAARFKRAYRTRRGTGAPVRAQRAPPAPC